MGDFLPGPVDPPVAPPGQQAETAVPWTVRDAWLGLGLAMLALLLGALAVTPLPEASDLEVPALTFAELLYLVPVVVILRRYRAPWRLLGFSSFSGSAMAVGCGLMVVTYAAILIHNVTLMLLGVPTQGESLMGLLDSTSMAIGIALASVLVAPFVEEVFFRGFLFQGLRRAYGWNRAALISSLIFGALHLQLAALIPTFLLGYALAIVFHRSNSIWPGIILHALVNGLAMFVLLAARQFPVPV
jgi:membrane protease YdiL (CAAX protease family)